MKSVQLTDDEIQSVIQYHAKQICNSGDGYSEYIERMKYLSKRLEDKPRDQPKTEEKSSW